MAQHKPTPEEQLLKLIENPDAAKSSGAKPSSNKKAVNRPLFPSLSFGNLWPSQGIKKGTKEKEMSEAPKAGLVPGLTLKTLNKLLIAMVIAAGIFLVLDLTIIKEDSRGFLADVSVNDVIFPIAAESGVAPRNLNYYQDALDRRNPFMDAGSVPAAGEGAEEEIPVPQPHSDKMAELLSNYKLVGMSWSAEEPLAMIEEGTTGRTFFLKRGQDINGVKIQAINKEKVTVTYKGEEGALY